MAICLTVGAYGPFAASPLKNTGRCLAAYNRDVNVDMHRWKFSALASAAYLCAALTSTDAAALALGSISVQSHLGQPLRAEVDVPQLSAEEESSLQTMVATPDIFQAHGMEYGNTARTLQIQVQRRPDGSAKLKLSTTAPVNEPFVDIIIQANWNAGNLVRSYTLLLDPAPTPQGSKAGTPAQISTPATTGRSYQSQPRAARAATPPDTATAAPSSADAQSVTVRPGDTAGRIAGAHRPAGISLDQMLVAMLQNNPHAFIQGNVNRIKAGTVIKLPTQEEAQSTSTQEARKIIAAQSRNFNAFRQKLASRTADAQLEAADRSATGKVQAQVADAGPTAAPSDKLTLSKGAISAQTEDKLAKQKQAAAQDERMQELQRNLSELETLNKNATGAQSTAGTVDADKAGAAGAGAAAGAAGTATPGVAVPGNLPAAPAVETPTSPPQAEMPTAPTAEEQPKPKPEPKKRPAPPPPPAPEPSFLENLLANPLVPAGGAAAVLLLGLLAWRSRKQKAAAHSSDAALDSAQLPPDSLFDSSGGQQVDTSNDGPASTMAYSPSQLDANGDVDPIAEADVYLAYNKDEEAQKILREALRNTPNNLPVHLKLAQIHAKNQELPQLEAVARTIHRLTEGQGSDWEQVRTLGRNTDPANPFYAQPGATAQESAPSSGFAQALAASSVAAPAAASAAAQPMDMDFDLGLDLDAAAPAKTAPEPEPQLNDEPSFIAALDSQLDVLAPQTHSDLPSQIIDTQFAQDLLQPEPAASPAAAPDAAPTLDLGSFGDLNLDLPTTEPTTAPNPVAEANDSASNTLDGLDFSLDADFGLTPPESTTAAATATPTAPAEDDFGLGQLDLGGDFPAPPASAEAGAKAEASPATSGDALGTKLDLAQEFAAIGDSEGARSLIEEVLAEASGTLKVRAEKMLSELD